MSKTYALSGARVAYLCASPHQLEGLRPLCPPWAVSLPAQIAAVKALVAERTKSTTAASPSESSRQTTDYYNRVGEAALACYEKNPADPLRWEAALIALKAMRSFVIEIKPGSDEAVTVTGVQLVAVPVPL